MKTSLTPRQVCIAFSGAYPAFVAGFEDIPRGQRQEEFGTTEADEAWEASTFELDQDGVLICTQSNDVVLVWDPSDEVWDDAKFDEMTGELHPVG